MRLPSWNPYDEKRSAARTIDSFNGIVEHPPRTKPIQEHNNVVAFLRPDMSSAEKNKRQK